MEDLTSHDIDKLATGIPNKYEIEIQKEPKHLHYLHLASSLLDDLDNRKCLLRNCKKNVKESPKLISNAKTAKEKGEATGCSQLPMSSEAY